MTLRCLYIATFVCTVVEPAVKTSAECSLHAYISSSSYSFVLPSWNSCHLESRQRQIEYSSG